MTNNKIFFSRSIMTTITLSVTAIIGITLISIFFSFWVTEQTDQDVQAINLSGSMRMQVYRIGLAVERKNYRGAQEYIKQLNQTWDNPLFSQQRSALHNQQIQKSQITSSFGQAFLHWHDILQPTLLLSLSGTTSNAERDNQLKRQLDTQVTLTHAIVNKFQRDADLKIKKLRSIQLAVLLVTVIVGSLIFTILKSRVEKPLSQLTDVAKKITEGNLNLQVEVEGNDELSLLGATFNQMTRSIADSHSKLEESVETRTRELKQNNTALDFLFNTAHKILNSKRDEQLDLQLIIDDLSDTIQNDDLSLCLFTEKGDKPYLQLSTSKKEGLNCDNHSCNRCRLIPLEASEASEASDPAVNRQSLTPIAIKGRNYGTISLGLPGTKKLLLWQKNLVQSVADQLAIALSLAEQKDQEYRYAMLSERTVIARELHDSLAQALSYLQIQVTRLQKTHKLEKFDLQQEIIDELREGLSSAYRQLRELLTTFRLKIDAGGLQEALHNTVQQLQERSDMEISLDFQVSNLRLSPAEEIHLLQIVREAAQNSIHHSKGKHVVIRLQQRPDNSVLLEIEDDGIGISSSPEKLNHYGLAIMNERNHSLGGSMEIQLREQGGTRVACMFEPKANKATI